MIRPLAIQDGYVWLRHDREEINGIPVGGHDGVLAIADLRRPTGEHKAERPAFLELPCPESDCGWMSTHPISASGAPEAEARLLQQVFVERFQADGCPLHKAIQHARDLIAAQDGPERDFLGAAATLPIAEESSMPETPESVEGAAPTLVSPDLGDAIIEQIDRTLATPFKSTASPLILELIDHIVVLRRALAHRNDALGRIRQTLVASHDLRDADVTSA